MPYLPTLPQSRSILVEPAPAWRWIVALPQDVNASITTNYYNSSSVSRYDSQGLLLTPVVPFGRAENVQIPGITISTDQRFGAAARVHYPRFLEVEAFNATFYEDFNYNTLMYFRSWRELIVDKYHNYYPSDNYKRTIYFFAFDGVDNEVPRFTLEMIGCFPTNPGTGMSYETNSNQAVTLSVSFSVDYVEMHWNPVVIGNLRSTNSGLNIV